MHGTTNILARDHVLHCQHLCRHVMANLKRVVCIVGSLVVLVCIIGVLSVSRGTPMYWKPRWLRTTSRKPLWNNINVTVVDDGDASGTSVERLQLNVTTAMTTQVDYKPLNMPCPGIFLPAEKLLEADWMATLQQFLSGLSSKQVNFVTANSQYEDELLNWLILVSLSINPPMENVLVLALDSELYDLLRSRRIPCIFIPTTAIMSPLSKDEHFESVWMIRLGLLRVLNWLGFDAAMYDADALVLKNPQPLFEAHATDIVASMATSWPPKFGRKWGFTLCNGVLFFRSNKRTGIVIVTISPPPLMYMLVNFWLTAHKDSRNAGIQLLFNECTCIVQNKQKEV